MERGARGLRLLALNPAARRLGLRAGQAHADATAMVPHLISQPAEPERDAAALRRLALWAERFSPLVAIQDGPPGDEALLIDMTGGAHLFGGEATLLEDIRRRLAQADIPARLALADTPAAAWALARWAGARWSGAQCSGAQGSGAQGSGAQGSGAQGSGQAETIAPPGGTRAALAGLPVEALRLEAAALGLMRRFGLKRIGDLYHLPRAGLARRFRGEAGLRVVERLDRALGGLADPLKPIRPAPLYRAWRVFAEPMTEICGLAGQLPDLTQALADQLDQAGLGARRLSLTAFRVDGRVTALAAGLSAPSADPAHLQRLLKEKGLEALDLGFGVDGLMLSADQAEPVITRQTRIEGEGAAVLVGAEAALIDRLQARLGEGAVRRPQARASWIPERSEAWVRADAPVAPIPDPQVQMVRRQPRPILLFDPPEPMEAIAEAPDGAPIRFVWRRAPRRVVKAQGPERLASEWWRVEAGARPGRTRDYYRVEDDQGRRYWLFREGLYGREDAERAPDWWMHGVFP